MDDGRETALSLYHRKYFKNNQQRFLIFLVYILSLFRIIFIPEIMFQVNSKRVFVIKIILVEKSKNYSFV